MGETGRSWEMGKDGEEVGKVVAHDYLTEGFPYMHYYFFLKKKHELFLLFHVGSRVILSEKIHEHTWAFRCSFSSV